MTNGPQTQPAGQAVVKTTAAGPAGSPAPDAATDLRAFLTQLVERACSLTGGLAGAIYLAASQGRAAGIAVSAPAAPTPNSNGSARAESLIDEAMLRRFERLGEQAASSGIGSAEELTISGRGALYDSRATHRVLAAPLIANGRSEGACLVLAPTTSPVPASEAITRMALAGAIFEVFLWRQHAMNEAVQKARLREAIELLDAAQQGADAASMAQIMCHELRRRFGCTRVSIGMIDPVGDRLRLIGVSGADNLDRRAPAITTIEAAMEECAAQDTEVVFPPPPEYESDPAQRRVTRAHEDLSRKFGPAAILSLPLRVEGDLAGVALLERDPADPFPTGAAALMRLVAEFIGPAVYTRRLADRKLLAVARDRALEIGSAIVGPRHTGAKLLGLLILIVLIGLAVIPIPDRTVAGGEVRAAAIRTIVPPFTGYLERVEVKSGDAVEQGAPLAVMDAGELRLQLAKAQAERETALTQRDEAQSKAELAKVRGFESQVKESDATIAAIEERIARSTLRAPIAGLVSRGDLDPFIGARVEPTQPLLEIVGRDLVVNVHIGERDIRRLLARQESDGAIRGEIAAKALPDRRVPIRIRHINAASEVVEGKNVYIAEAVIEAEPGQPAPDAGFLRPGMTGVVKLHDGVTTGLVSFLRPLIDELRLRFWW